MVVVCTRPFSVLIDAANELFKVQFFVINIVGNFGTVFLDNGYYNKAIAASPVDALPGYIMGFVLPITSTM
jgi:hypothetical protein